MRRILTVALQLSLFVPLASAQHAGDDKLDDRPTIKLPDPERKKDSGNSYLVSSLNYPGAQPGVDRFASALPALLDHMRRETNLESRISLNSLTPGEMALQTPLLLHITGGKEARLHLNAQGKKALQSYLDRGGFIFAESVMPVTSGSFRGFGPVPAAPFLRQIKAIMIELAGGEWDTVPNSHAVNHSYFKFPDGPPKGRASGVRKLEMLQRRGRILVLAGNLGLAGQWANQEARGQIRALQYGTNIIAFAITQKMGGGLGR